MNHVLSPDSILSDYKLYEVWPAKKTLDEVLDDLIWRATRSLCFWDDTLEVGRNGLAIRLLHYAHKSLGGSMSFEYFGDHHTRALYDYRIITKELHDELVESRKVWKNREQDIFVVQSAVKNESAVSDN